jgi:hypothetical protein
MGGKPRAIPLPTPDESLIPADLTRCQADKPNGESFMTLGGGHKMVRCESVPTVVAYEQDVQDDDGMRGSMSLCDDCLKVFEKQMPDNYIFESIAFKVKQT